MIKKLFTLDDSYNDMTSMYSMIDGTLAITMYVLLTLVYFLMGVIAVKKQIYLGIPISLLVTASCILLVVARRQKLNSIGITSKNIRKSLLIGMILGIIFSFFKNGLPNLQAEDNIITVNQALYDIFYYFVIISLSEEIIFRGYIQTRIYGLIKHDISATTVVGFLFYTMHLPFQMYVNGKQVGLYDMVITIVMHFILNFLYRKYNSLVAPTMFHGFFNWYSDLLQ